MSVWGDHIRITRLGEDEPAAHANRDGDSWTVTLPDGPDRDGEISTGELYDALNKEDR